ncbi:hypothetical protein BaRGS_00032103, partial [Batillaria attramentaria]
MNYRVPLDLSPRSRRRVGAYELPTALDLNPESRRRTGAYELLSPLESSSRKQRVGEELVRVNCWVHWEFSPETSRRV